MAVGLTLIFGVMRVVNFAHGDMMVWGMYLAWLLATPAGVDPYLGFVVCAAALFVLGLVDPARARAPHRRRAPRDADPPDARRRAGARERRARGLRSRAPCACARRSPPSRSGSGPIFVDVARLVTFGVAIVLTLALWPLPLPHRPRARIRAAADNPYGALVIGTDVRRVYAVAFGVGRRLRGRGGGARVADPAVPARGRAHAVGRLVQHRHHRRDGQPASAPSWAGSSSRWPSRSARCSWSPSLKELVSFSLLIVILLFRPAGLFGKRVA